MVEETYRRLFPLIVHKCARMLGNTAEAQDIAQETFVRFWRSQGKLRDDKAGTAWIYRTCTNLAIDRLRTLRPQTGGEGSGDGQVVIDGFVKSHGDPTHSMDARRLLAVLARRMPADELEVLVLARVDGLTQPEIAEVIGASERTVRRRLTSSLERLARVARNS